MPQAAVRTIRQLAGLTGILVILTGSLDAQPPEQPDIPPTASPRAPSAMERLFAWPPVIFRDTEYGDVPHGGEVDAPGRGYPHYDRPAERYGPWYRPKSFGLGVAERCRPRPFRPHGYGSLFNDPSTCYRMDYHPYVLKSAVSRFGPSYHLRRSDPRCPPHAYKSRDLHEDVGE